jgi:hypothetical protein
MGVLERKPPPEERQFAAGGGIFSISQTVEDYSIGSSEGKISASFARVVLAIVTVMPSN